MKRGLRLFAAALGFLLLLSGCNLLSAGAPTPVKVTLNGYTIDRSQGKVNFNLSAFDAQGNLIGQGTVENPQVTGLSAEDSSGSPVTGVQATATVCGQITVQQNVTCAITLDATGSMSSNDPNEDRNAAAKAFIDRMTAGDLAGVASFDTGTTPTGSYLAIHIWQDFTSDTAALKNAVDSATFAGSATNLWDAVYDDVDWLLTQSTSNRIALVLTDGLDNSSSKTAQEAADYATQHGIKVYMVGLGDPNSLDFTSMQDVATQTGGLFAVAQDPAQLTNLFDGIFNASKASFCITVTFTINGSPPPAGTHITGTLTFVLNGTPSKIDFDVIF